MSPETNSGPESGSLSVDSARAQAEVRTRELRRDLITKGGLIAGGALMLTIANRPAWASNSCAASMKVNLSTHCKTNNGKK